MTTTDISFGELVSVVAFYGIEHSAANVETFFDLSLRWFDFVGHKPNLGHAIKGNKPRAIPITKIAAWRADAEWDTITGCGLDAIEPDGEKRYPCMITNYDGGLRASHAEFVANQSIVSLDRLAMSQVVEEAVRFLKPAYGIGFLREKTKGPWWYAVGINYGPAGERLIGEEYEQAVREGHWGGIGIKEQVYRLGYLRNIYPFNFLSQPQLEREIEGFPLREWIAQGSGRGKLTSFAEHMSLWTVEPNQTHEVQQHLERAGIIFDYKKWLKN
ncbi:MAG TPA: hypothetical protein VM260_20035, partial [Pirellula sp.]|nr:hypothetical protein [Pirellula sp.]